MKKSVQKLEKATVGQHDNPLWIEARCHCLTTSCFSVVYTMRKVVSCDNLRANNVKIEPCCLFVSKERSYLGVSPDGLIGDSWLVEVKFLLSIGMTKITELARTRKICFCYSMKLKKTHKYQFQVQGKLVLSGWHYCDVILFSDTGAEGV
ncbi:hypothetical protein PR048_005954 [Dryococelus australis]|uniref:YqaJ viral recombinase domain-containing protein n=1 Tax=Dryococelus australis TaxID=614101 RepID=A0ABQ9IBT0_9NEOP|nr:hypothetical protein PR048_005954 [Dryococelus australis]